jgi:hypothetical protein
MITFEKPENLNGAELLIELKANGISITDSPTILDDGSFWLNISEADKDKTTIIVAMHNGTTIAPEPTIVEKLASVGLSIEELKAALS